MKKLMLAAAGLAGAVPLAVLAAPPEVATIDGYYVVSPEIDIEIDGLGEATVDEGDGFGVKARFNVAPQFFLAGEYQANTYDEVEGVPLDAELNQLRGGLGLRLGAGSPFYILGEAINLELELDDEKEDDTGFGAHFGADAAFSDVFSLYGQIGYIDVAEADGVEFLVGGALMITPGVGAFVDYRNSTLEDDESEVTLSDLRVGLRIALR